MERIRTSGDASFVSENEENIYNLTKSCIGDGEFIFCFDQVERYLSKSDKMSLLDIDTFEIEIKYIKNKEEGIQKETWLYIKENDKWLLYSKNVP